MFRRPGRAAPDFSKKGSGPDWAGLKKWACADALMSMKTSTLRVQHKYVLYIDIILMGIQSMTATCLGKS